MLISVAIPAHNRPDLLLEAIKSIEAQSYPHWEVVIVDDGSTPPLDTQPFEAILGTRLVFVRHDAARGVAAAKNVAMEAAKGEIVVLLDDDDMLAPDALASVAQVYALHPELGCVFLGVERFGPYAGATGSKGRESLQRILRQTRPAEDELAYLFGSNLFDALLGGVPIEFQRPAVRRGVWNIVGGFSENGLFSESTWAIRIAALCSAALIKNPVSKWRIHGHNFGWVSDLGAHENAMRKSENHLATSIELLRFFDDKRADFSNKRTKIAGRTATAYFGMAWGLRELDRLTGFSYLLKGFALGPEWKFVKLGLTYFIPEKVIKRLKR